MSKSIVWFRNDLRIADNEVLHRAAAKSDEVYTVYCFDPRDYGQLPIGASKMSPFRAKFLLETLSALRLKIRKLGGDLMILFGNPEVLIPDLAEKLSIDHVMAEKSAFYKDIVIENELESRLWQKGISLDLIWQNTLYHVEDIPWPIGHLPEVFTDFRKELESVSSVRPMVDTPPLEWKLTAENTSELPTIKMLGLDEAQADERAVMSFEGGEETGRRRLRYYLWETDQITRYKETRNNSVGADYSTKLSPWLAVGAISPRYIYYELKKYEDQRTKNESTYWLYFELLWRDYFRFVAKKHGESLVDEGGIKKRETRFEEDQDSFDQWCRGETGVPFVDANMTELNQTGFMSNRGRQNVASYLINDLGLNWTWGAMYFQSRLLDYDPHTNWGNWNYLAGVGNDPRPDRYFNIQAQAERYDPHGEFVSLWVNSLPDH